MRSAGFFCWSEEAKGEGRRREEEAKVGGRDGLFSTRDEVKSQPFVVCCWPFECFLLLLLEVLRSTRAGVEREEEERKEKRGKMEVEG